jgi:release factor glutamine methyltransferase
MTDTPKTLKQVLDASADYLTRQHVEEPRLVAELLAARLLNCKRLQLPLRYDAALGDKHLEAMRRGIRRLADGEPVQYIMGQTEFMGHVFRTDKRALIPRPETELLVEEVARCPALWQREDGADRPCIVDVGTGSGCIVISLALARPEAHYLALDTSAEAVALARENAAALEAADRITFAVAELSDCLEPEMADAIVANLPYVSTAEYERLPRHIRAHEPRCALDGGPRGLSVIEVAIQDAACGLKAGGRIFLEIGAGQGAAVHSLLDEGGFANIAIKKDLAGHDRIAMAVLPQV